MAGEQVAAPVPGTPEYDAAMVAKVDETAAKALSASTETGITATRPDNVPEQFWNSEKGEVDTEAMLADWAARTTVTKDPEKAPTEEAPEGDAKAAVEAKGFDFNVLQDEFTTNGDLTPETREKLAAAGFDKAIVDSYIAGQQALADQLTARAYDAAGGKEAFTAMQEWAASSLTADEQAAYNKAVEGSEAEAMQAVTALRAKYESAYGKQPGLIGGNPSTGSNQGYASKAEMVAEMRDARYDKDPAYRARVQARVAASTAF